MRRALAMTAAILALSAPFPANAAGATPDGLVPIPAGLYAPFERLNAANGAETATAQLKHVGAFRLEAEPVTNAAFLEFVTTHPEWRKSRIKTLFADARYLRRWPSDLALADGPARDKPVIDVSWFAAHAYCKALGLKLPTTEEWEYALADAGRRQETVRARSLEWLAEPNGAGPGAIGGSANGYRVSDMVGLVWEWTDDFSAYATTAESLDPDGKDSAEFCGAAAAGVADATDYPAFMRYAMRASLKANYTAANLGFRCAGDAP
jgi:formylglycine-generating enzyme